MPSATENNMTNFMQAILILYKYMFSDIIPCGITSELHLYINLTYHVLLGQTKVCLSCKGLYVMCEGLHVMHEGSVCHAT